jgi:hypothetical protein
MPPVDSQILERIECEGMIGARTAIVVGVMLAVIAAWFLWRERGAAGRGWAAAFWILRVTAFAFALWMLAGPTQLRTERTTTNQAVAIFADNSESMDTIDSPEPCNELRWTLAADGTAKSPLSHCDRVVVDLGAARAGCQKFDEYVRQHRPTRQLDEPLAAIRAAITRAISHIEKLEDSLDRKDAKSSERATRVAALLNGPISKSLAAIHAALDSSGRSDVTEMAVQVEQLGDSLASANRRAQALASDLAERESTAGNDQKPDIASLPRRKKAMRALDALESHLGADAADHVRIERFRFDHVATPVSPEIGWSKALEAAPPTSAAAQEKRTGSNPDGENLTSESSTNISAVLQKLATQDPGHLIRLAMILSDGRHNATGAPLPQEVAARLSNLPVYVVPIGNSDAHRDAVLHRVEAPSVVAEKDSVLIDVIVTGIDCAGQQSFVQLKHDGKVIDRKPVQFTGARDDYRVRFNVATKELGWQEYLVEVEPVEGEANTANNFQPVSFEVVRDRIRVFMTDSVARWEYRYLNQLFRRDEHVESDELLYYPSVHGTGRLADRPECPATVEEWARYDVVILGDIGPQQLSAASQKGLDEFIRKRGGNLIIVAGQNSMPAAFQGLPLMDLMPVEAAKNVSPQQGFTLSLTEEGRFNSALLVADSADESAQTWESIFRLFPVVGMSEYCRPKSTARTLIKAVSESAGEAQIANGQVEHAFLCWQRVGAGRVAYVAAPEIWRLRWRRGDRLHHRFWGQFLRWMTAASAGTGSNLVRIQTDHSRYMPGELVQVTVWLKDASGRPMASAAIAAEARTFNGKATSVELSPDPEVAGRYFGTLTDLPAGAYQVGVRGRVISDLLPAADEEKVAATITVRGADSAEMLNTRCNRALLEQVAQTTGGQVIPPTAMEEVFDLVSFTPQVHENVQRKTLWNRWSSLIIVVGCLFTEWIVRKSKGLV